MRITVAVAVACLSIVGLSRAAEIEAAIRKPTHIPAQELGSALQHLARDHGFQVVYVSDEVNQLKTQGASGELTSEEALSQLLKGTGLTYRYLGDNAVSITSLVESRESYSSSSFGSSSTSPAAGAKEEHKGSWFNRLRLAQADAGQSDAPDRSDQSKAAPSEKTDGSLEEIVVTAQRREESIQDASVAVTALSGEQLLEQGVTDFLGLSTIAPGFQIAEASSHIKPAMRGATSTENSPSVAFYMDGIYLEQPSQALAAFADVERVEVMRGPQGTLFGRNSFGGLVHVITRQPTDQFDAGADITVGNYSNVRTEGFLNVPFTDQLFFRLTGVREERDGYVENVVDPDNYLKDADMRYVRGKLRWVPTDRIDMTLSADYWKDTSNGPGEISHYFLGVPVDPVTNQTNGVTGVLQPRIGVDPTGASPGGRFGAGNTPTLTDPYQIQSNSANRRDLDQVGVYGLVNWNLGFALAKVQLGYTDYTEFFITDGDQSPLSSTVQGDNIHSETATQEIQLTSPAGEDRRLQWVIGAYFSQQDNVGAFYQHFLNDCCTANFPDESSPSGNMTFAPLISQQRITSGAGFGQATFSITDKFRIVGGARYTEERQKHVGLSTPTLAVPPNAFKNLDPISFDTILLGQQSLTFEKATWKAGFEFDVTEDNLLYAHASTGFLAGAFNYLALFIPGIPETVDERTITAYEIGSKNTLFDGRLILNVAAYRNIMEDLLSGDFIDVAGVALGFVTNAGGVTSTGLELEASWAPVEQALIGVRAAYMQAEYDDFLGINNFSAGEDFIQNGVGLFQLKGSQVQQSPDFTVGLSGSYEFPVGAVGTITPYLEFYYSSEYRAHELPYFFAVQDAYTRTDLSLRWRSADERWGAQLYVRNLEDDEVINNAERFGGDLAAVSLAPPRTYGLRVSYSYE